VDKYGIPETSSDDCQRVSGFLFFGGGHGKGSKRSTQSSTQSKEARRQVKRKVDNVFGYFDRPATVLFTSRRLQMNGLKLAMVALLVACSASPALAEPVELEPVVVTATRTARPSSEVISSVTVITAEEIALSGARTLAEVLRKSVGVHVKDNGPRGSLATLSIRGSTAEQVLVLLDGVRLNSAQDGMFDMSNLPVAIADIERIEILRGPASALYGSNALGGVIQIFTRKATSEPMTRLSYNEGRFSTRDGSFATSGTKGDIRYQLGASRGHSDGYRDNSELDQTTFNAMIGYSLPAGFDLSVSGYQSDKDSEVPGKAGSLPLGANQQDDISYLALSLSGPVGPFKVTARPNYSRQRRDYQIPAYGLDYRHIVETYGIELQGELAKESHLLVIGGDFYQDELDSTGMDDKLDQERWSLFSQYEYQFSPRLTFLLGLRYDVHSEFSNEVSPRAGIKFDVTDSTRLRISGGRAYRPPILNDLYWPYSSFPLYDNRIYQEMGNPDLDPETSWEYEVAIDQKLGQIGRLTVAFFDRYVDDLITWYPPNEFVLDGFTYEVWQPKNVNDARIYGAEVEAYLQPAKLLGVGLNYTYLHPKDRKTGDYLTGRARHEANAYVEVGPLMDTVLRLDGS
jgi:outer membrane cobalamin receptor